MWGVGSGKLEFLDILRTIDKKFKCLKFQIPKLRDQTDNRELLLPRMHELFKFQFWNSKFHYSTIEDFSDHRIWQASIKKVKLPLRNSNCLRPWVRERGSFWVLGSEPILIAENPRSWFFVSFSSRKKKKKNIDLRITIFATKLRAIIF